MNNKNNIALMDSYFTTQGFISLFIIVIIMGVLIFHLANAYQEQSNIIKHKVDVEIEKKLYY